MLLSWEKGRAYLVYLDFNKNNTTNDKKLLTCHNQVNIKFSYGKLVQVDKCFSNHLEI